MDDHPTSPSVRFGPDSDAPTSSDLGLVFTALCLHCTSCKAVFYETIAGRVRRVKSILVRIDEKGRAHALANLPCPECLSTELQLWELL